MLGLICYNFKCMNKKFNIITADYKTSAVKQEQFLTDLPEFAFVGRSNVGKSSLINSLTNKKRLAKTSITPGLTKMVNYFIINNSFYFVDLPGYGFSRTGKSHRELWSDLIEKYLMLSKQLRLVFLLLDIRHTPTELDMNMLKFLYLNNIPVKIIATKSDKVAKSKVKHYCQELAKKLFVGVEDIIPYSAEKPVAVRKFPIAKQTTDKTPNAPNKTMDKTTQTMNGKEKILDIIKNFLTL